MNLHQNSTTQTHSLEQYSSIEEAQEDFVKRLNINRIHKAKTLHRLMSDRIGSEVNISF